MYSRTDVVGNNAEQVKTWTLVFAAAVAVATLLALSRVVSNSNAYDLLAFGSFACAAGLVRLQASRNVPAGWADSVVVIASVPSLGLLAWVPSVLATFGRLAVQDSDHNLRQIMAELVGSCVTALTAAWVYTLASRQMAIAGSTVSIPAAVLGALVLIAARFAFHKTGSEAKPRPLPAATQILLISSAGVLMALWTQSCPRPIMIATGALLSLAYATRTLWSHNSSTASLPATDDENQDETQVDARPTMVDPLTGLANDRYLYMFLRQEIGRSVRKDLPLSLLVLDIDDFQCVNKTSGTDAGDSVLKELSRIMKGLIREYDLVGRHTEDGFAIILPETTCADAFDTAERIRGHIADARFSHLPGVQVSVGVASYPQHGCTPDDLMSSAHHALNRAKFSGKNRVVSCTDIADKLMYGT